MIYLDNIDNIFDEWIKETLFQSSTTIIKESKYYDVLLKSNKYELMLLLNKKIENECCSLNCIILFDDLMGLEDYTGKPGNIKETLKYCKCELEKYLNNY